MTMTIITFDKQVTTRTLQCEIISVFGDIGKDYIHIEYTIPYTMYRKYPKHRFPGITPEKDVSIEIEYDSMYEVTVYDEDGTAYTLEGIALTREICLRLWEVTEDEENELTALAFKDYERYHMGDRGFTKFILVRGNAELVITSLNLVRVLLKQGWKIKHNTLSELI